MKSHQRLSELLVKTGAFKDLETPVILTSGQLGIYYINTEKLVQDGGEFNKYGDSSKDMIEHAVRMTQEHPTFDEVIDILSDEVENIIIQRPINAISGGQRRDWLFSGPVARKLDIPHVSIYKDGKAEVIAPNGKVFPCTRQYALEEMYHAHIVDLLTEGSSCYSKQGEIENGWIPEIRKRHGIITDLIAVVTRLQGGEENLRAQSVEVNAKVAINNDFLNQHSKSPKRALEYNNNPELWSKEYLSSQGALALLPTFNPKEGKLDRAKKFMKRYEFHLKQTGRLEELNNSCKEEYGKGVKEILAD